MVPRDPARRASEAVRDARHQAAYAVRPLRVLHADWARSDLFIARSFSEEAGLMTLIWLVGGGDD